MKLLNAALFLGALSTQANAYTYNGFKNHELEKYDGPLFGRRLAQKKARQLKETEAVDGNLRQRRTEGEIPTPPEMSSDEGSLDEDGGAFTGQDREQQSHYEAESISFFKKGIDPDFFEWVNPDEVMAASWTCGFMKPDLGSDPNQIFPTIEVYVCIRFADVQPAKKGNIFTHCGGPGSLSGCPMLTFLGEDALTDFNFITIDQRGMGRSSPTFAQYECSDYEITRAENGTIISVEYPADAILPDFSDVESIKASLEPGKRKTQRCWGADDFKLSAEQEDGSVNNYHFLEYSGSRQLAEDVERIRALINAPAMHIYGISYGTQVFGTYATIFPGSVGLMVLDGNVNPYQDLEAIAHDQGVGENTRISYALFSCSAKNADEPGSCPVNDLSKCVSDIGAGLASIEIDPGAEAKAILGDIISVLLNVPDRAQEICDLAAAGDFDGMVALVDELIPEDPIEAESRKFRQGFNEPSRPTSCPGPLDCPIYGFEDDYYFLAESSGTVLQMVNAQDAFSALYDADYFARRVKEFGEFYTGAGTGSPVQTFYVEWSAGFNWPKGVPLAPMGNPLLTGIVSGQLYDYATPYVWTQDMRQNFKFTNLLTSQYTQHGLGGGNAPDCQQHIIDYFTLGYVSFVDGTVCGADFADTSLITAAFGLGK